MTPQEQLNDLLKQLSVGRIVVVDDDFILSAGAALLAFGEVGLPDLPSLTPLPEDGDLERHLDEHWDSVSIEDRITATKKAGKVDGFVLPDPTGLRELLGEDAPGFRGMTMHEWKEKSEGILAATNRNLVLFDVDFSKETGEEGDESGLELAAAALQSREHIIGLLTNRAEIGKEEAEASEMAGRAQVPTADFVIVNKRQLGDLEDTEALAAAVEQIRVTMQASRLGHVRTRVSQALTDGISDVEKRLGDHTSAVLEDVVFRSSHAGGEWEGDTWFRVYDTLGLERARQEVAVDTGVRAAVADVRNLLLSRGERELDADAEKLLVEITQAECYETASFINGAGLPIANGDIFTVTGGATFILVAQPCDLALRPTGRAYEPKTVTLLPIKPAKADDARPMVRASRTPTADAGDGGGHAVKIPPAGKIGAPDGGRSVDDAQGAAAGPEEVPEVEKHEERAAESSGESQAAKEADTAEEAKAADKADTDSERSAYLLPDGGPFEAGSWEVRFRPEYHVAFDVVDLCSSNAEGRATTKPPKGTALEPLLPGVKQRYEQIREREERHKELLDRLDALERDEHLAAEDADKLRAGILDFSAPFTASFGKRPAAYDFECTRIGRLAGTYADALLAAHSNARARTAHAHELTRIVRRD